MALKKLCKVLSLDSRFEISMKKYTRITLNPDSAFFSKFNIEREQCDIAASLY